MVKRVEKSGSVETVAVRSRANPLTAKELMLNAYEQAAKKETAVRNGLADALGYNHGGMPMPHGVQSEQVSQTGTIFKSLRGYLVSNMRQALSEAYVELGLVQTVCDVPVDDALRGGIEIKSKQLDPNQIEELRTSIDRNDDLTVAGQAAKWTRLFGGGAILILVDDQDPEEELDLEALTEDTEVEFRAVDMWELFWDKQGTDAYAENLETRDIEFYNYYGENVHSSRVLPMKGLNAPSFVRPRLRGWGFSVVEVLVRSINQYLKATNLSFEVLDEFKLDVYKIKNLVNTLMMGAAGQQKILERVQLANWQKNYQNAVVMDSEDDFDHKQLSFSGLAEAQTGIRMQVASDVRMPLTKLFGISSAGFNSGEDDIEVYNSMVESQVRSKLKYHLLRIVEIRCQQLFGFVPDDISLTFKPLRMLSATDEEGIKTQKFTRLMQAKERGEISTQEFRDACNKGNLLDIQLDTADDELDFDSEDRAGEGEGDPGEAEDDKALGLKRVDREKAPKADSREPIVTPIRAAPALKAVNEIGYEAPLSTGTAIRHRSMGRGHKLEMDFVRQKFPKLVTDGHEILAADLPEQDALAFVEYLRKKDRHASILHMEGPSSGPESKYSVIGSPYPRQRNGLTIMPHAYTTAEQAVRSLQNSAAFDKASYEADGGDGWIDARCKHFFEDPKNVDVGLWQKAREASMEAFGEVRWQFQVWIYKKLGGSFQ